METATPHSRLAWVNRTVVGIIVATFFSDVSHEMCTAVLPLFLATVGLGPAALGVIEGLADLLMSLSKLGGGVLGHHSHRKTLWTTLGYLVTTLATAAIGLVHGLAALLSLRSAAWVGRGFRSPLRDFLLADAVEPTHLGRAYGLERAGDMFGAVVGPLLAAMLVWWGVEFRTVILWALLPGLVSAGAMYLLAKDRAAPVSTDFSGESLRPHRPSFPKAFWIFLVGVLLFGMGDFSRTFLIWLAAQGLGETTSTSGVISVAVLLYTLHNLASALAAYPVGHWGDHGSKLRVLLIGYSLGVLTNVLLAVSGSSLSWLIVAIVLSGVYIAAEETIEKAVAAELLPRELRSLGFGILACVNAVGDMTSSLYVGFLLEAGHRHLAFGIAAALGLTGVIWLLFSSRGLQKSLPQTQQ